MKAVIHYLTKQYGNTHYNTIVSWVNSQYAKSGTIHGQQISLADVNDFEIVGLLKNTVELLSIPLGTLVTGMHLLPRVNSTGSNFEAILKLNHKAFEKHYVKAGMITNDIIFAHEGDDVQYSGGSEHIKYKLNPANEDKPVICGFINYSVEDSDIIGSIIIAQDEIEGEKISGTANMFNGVDVLSDDDWLSSSCALLFKRLLSETNSTSLLKTLKSEEVSYIRELIALSESFYEYSSGNNQKRNDDFYSDYGRLIGRCYKRFNAVDKIVHASDKKKDNVTPISLAKNARKAKAEQTDPNNDPKPPGYAERTKAKGFSKF